MVRLVEKAIRFPLPTPLLHALSCHVDSTLLWPTPGEDKLCRTHLRGEAWRTLSTSGIAPQMKRMMLPEVHAVQPWLDTSFVFVSPIIAHKSGADTPEDRHAGAVAFMRPYAQLEGALQCWTDGSVSTHASASGCGICYVLGDQAIGACCKASGSIADSTFTELMAILLALDNMPAQLSAIRNRIGTTYVFSDSSAALHVISQGPSTKNESGSLIWQRLVEIHVRFQMSFVFQHVPSHCGLLLNERADRLAKQASCMNQASCPSPLSATVSTIKHHLLRSWRAQALQDGTSGATYLAKLGGKTMGARLR